MKNNSAQHTYIFPDFEQPVKNEEYTIKSLMSFFLLFNSIIPLDLAIAYTIIKAWYTVFMIDDHNMIDIERSCDENNVVGCEIKNLTTIEDLSMVNNIFCDKTGTLTKNQLIFRGMGINEKSFEMTTDKDSIKKFINEVTEHAKNSEWRKKFLDLWRCICVCHEVIQFEDEKDKKAAAESKEPVNHKNIKYTGTSLDEITFIDMCRDVGLAYFVERDQKCVKIVVDGN